MTPNLSLVDDVAIHCQPPEACRRLTLGLLLRYSEGLNRLVVFDVDQFEIGVGKITSG